MKLKEMPREALQQFYVEAKAEYAGASTLPDLKIITWKTISTRTWTPDTRQPVYNKGESK